MTAEVLKKILESVEDEDEVMVNGYEGAPTSIEYVTVFDSGDVWIVSNMVSVEEYSKYIEENRQLRKENEALRNERFNK